jgi:osmotically-inducible protein OsmY
MNLLTCLDSGSRDSAEDGSAVSDLSEILQEQLRRNPHADLRGVQVAVENGTVRLLGRVPSFHAKQIAQITIGEHFRAWRVENAIDVA